MSWLWVDGMDVRKKAQVTREQPCSAWQAVHGCSYPLPYPSHLSIMPHPNLLPNHGRPLGYCQGAAFPKPAEQEAAVRRACAFSARCGQMAPRGCCVPFSAKNLMVYEGIRNRVVQSGRVFPLALAAG